MRVGEGEIKEIERSAPRVRWLARIALLWAALILARLIQLQVIRHGEYRRLAQEQQEHLIEIRPPRGTILDRNGQRLAMSLPVESIYVNPLLIPNVDVASVLVARILHLDQAELAAELRDCVARKRGFLWIKRKAPQEEADQLRDLRVDWIQFVTESRRFYPYGTLAAHVVGSVDSDEKGLEGVELKLNSVLGGRPGKMLMISDVKQRGFESEEYGTPVEPGRDARLTIDARIQYVADRALKATVLKNHCRTGSLVVMDPRTGKILALSSYPTYDPNQPPRNAEDRRDRFNQAVSVPFEPGSVFKVVTLTSALETTNLRPETIIPCGGGAMTFFGHTVHDHEPHSALSLADVLARSSNIGAINIGLKVGRTNLYDYIRRFGFGQRTGVALPGESPGLLWRLERWQPSSIAAVPMGHEIMVTTLQLARACSVIANGGFLVKPQLLEDAPPQPPKQVVRPETVITMRNMMEGVILRGTGKFAHLDGYTAGGKTGTAQIVDLQTHRYTHFYNSSFMGFAPLANPALVVVVTANGASGHLGFGAEVAAPVFKEVMTAALRFMEVPRDLPDDVLPFPDDGKVVDNDLAIADLSDPSLLVPPDETAGGSSGDQQAFFVPASNPVAGPQVPNFMGMTVRDVARESSESGIEVETVGSGLVRAQYPPAGAALSPGERVRLRFER